MIVNPGIRRFLGSAIQRLFNSASVSLPLTHSLIPTRGDITPAFTRASTATFRDWEGVLRTVPSGCARFEGARMVRNRFSKTEDLTDAAWTTLTTTVTAGQSDPDGGTSAFRLLIAAGSGIYQSFGASGEDCTEAWYVKSNTGASQNIRFNIGGTVSANVVATTAWQRLEANAVSTGTIHAILDDGASGADILVWHPQSEDVTGQADQTASEYVSVGVLSAPYHGAGVDGVEFFNTDRDGAVIPAATNTGYLAEGARTQILATADIRDMTTAAWTLGATMTRARTSVGADGAANSATRLTGGAVAATNTCYTTITAAASSRTYSALVKRVTGTGPVRIVQTGTETDISSQLATTGYALVQLTASVLNVAVGFKIDTNGDAIDVDFNQFEAGAFASSRIAAVGTRAADVLTYPSAGNIDGTVGWCYAEVKCNGFAAGVTTAILEPNTFAGYLYNNAGEDKKLASYDGTSTVEQTGPSSWIGRTAKLSSSWGGATRLLTADGATPASGAFDGAFPTTTPLYVGAPNGVFTASALFGTIRNVRIGQRQLSASEMQAITA